MDHETAVQILAVESYLLGEMTPGEREDFESHYFECQECAQDIRDAMQVMDGAKQLPASPPQAAFAKPGRQGWFGWLQPQMAGGIITVLAAACIVEAVLIPSLHRDGDVPRIAGAVFLPPQTRGSDKVIKAASGAPLVLMFDLPESVSGKLQFVVKSQEGKEEFRGLADTPPSGESLTLSIPEADWMPGKYVLVVEAPAPAGQDGQELSRYPFELQRP